MYLRRLAIATTALLCTISASAQQAEPQSTISRTELRNNRGISNLRTHIVPKGQWVFGGTGTYSTHVNSDYKFLVIEDIDSKGYSFKISPLIGYSLTPNTIIGLRGGYSRGYLDMDSAALHLGEGDGALNFGVEYYYMLKHSYEIAAIWRQYIPLGKNQRLGLFAEFQLSAGSGQSKFAEGSPIRGTFSESINVALGVNPGIVAFITNNMALEINVGMLGIGYSKTKQVHNQISTGHNTSSSLNYKVNIFSLGLGLAFYL